MAKSMAKQNSIDLSLLTGTGPSGRIVKKDIEAKCMYIQLFGESFLTIIYSLVNDAASSTISSNLGRSSVSSGHRPRTFKDIELSNMRQTIAKRLSESTSTIPHFYLTSEVKVEQLQSIREQLNKSISKPQKLSINDFIIKAVALTLRQFPQVNASWMGTKIRQYDYIDVSVAVSTESGLITPIVHNADQLSVMDISGKIKLLAQKAKENKLKPEEFQVSQKKDCTDCVNNF